MSHQLFSVECYKKFVAQFLLCQTLNHPFLHYNQENEMTLTKVEKNGNFFIIM